MSGNTSKRYPAELKERAVRMVAGAVDNGEREWAAVRWVAELLGVGSAETVRKVGPSGAGRGRRPARCQDRGGG